MLYVKKDGKLELIAGASTSGCPVGFVGGFAGGVPNDNWLECDGSTFDQYKYPALYTYLGTNVLPDYRNRFLEGVGEGETVGTNKEAGLPNITAWTSPLHYNPSGATASGAMYIGSQLDYWSKNTSGSAFNSVRQLNFDASRSSSVYGKSTTVQPASTLIRWCIKATSAGIDVDTSLYATKGYVDDLIRTEELVYDSSSGSGSVCGVYSGYISGSRTAIIFEIPCNTKGLKSVIVDDATSITVRSEQGYVRNSYDSPITIDRTTYNTLVGADGKGDAYAIGPTGIILNLQRVGGADWSTSANPVANNVPLSVVIKSGKITLNYER